MHRKSSAAVKSAHILIGITIAFLVFMTYINIFGKLVILYSDGAVNNWAIIAIILEVAGFVALFLLLRKKKREKNGGNFTIQSDLMPVGNQPKDEEPSRTIPPPKEKEPDYSLDDSKLK